MEGNKPCSLCGQIPSYLEKLILCSYRIDNRVYLCCKKCYWKLQEIWRYYPCEDFNERLEILNRQSREEIKQECLLFDPLEYLQDNLK